MVRFLLLRELARCEAEEAETGVCHQEGWNYFGAEKMQQVIGLMREQEQTADKSQKKNRQNSIEL